MYKNKRKILALLLSILCVFSVMSLTVSADSQSYAYNEWGKSLPAPESYVQSDIISGMSSGTTEFKEPQALYRKDNELFVVDTGNNRIVALDEEYKFKYEIAQIVGAPDGVAGLNKPQGIFIDDDGYRYICDTGNHRILKTDAKNNCLMVLTKPKSELIGDSLEFNPTKVVVNRSGNILVVADGIYMGLVNYDKNGNFQGFFGGNRVEVTAEVVARKMWRRFMTEEQKQSSARSLPVEYSNITIHDDLIYAVAKSTTTSTDELKKLNSVGTNVFTFNEEGGFTAKNDFGDLEKVWAFGSKTDNWFTAADINDQGNIALLDTNRGHIFVYDEDVNLMHIFGNVSGGDAGLTRPVDIVNHGESYLVLDQSTNNIKLFTPTPYAEKVNAAIKLYQSNDYADSEQVWRDILKVYSNSRFAYLGLGKICLQKGDYKNACEYFKLAKNRSQYSIAFREYRKELISDNLLWIVLGFVAVIIILKYLIHGFKKWMGYPVKTRKHKTKGA